MYCRNCGKELLPSDEYCCQCGLAVDEENYAEQGQQSVNHAKSNPAPKYNGGVVYKQLQKKKSTFLPWLLFAITIALVGGLVAGYFIFNKPDEVAESVISTEGVVAETETEESESEVLPHIEEVSSAYVAFYGIWCGASANVEDITEEMNALTDHGFNATYVDTSRWANLNAKRYYALTAGRYKTKEDADKVLASVKRICPDAYIKHSGRYIPEISEGPQPFYGVWCAASKDTAPVSKAMDRLLLEGYKPIYVSTEDWSGLNANRYYAVSAGSYGSKAEAERALSSVQSIYPDAYIKYSGTFMGNY